MTSIVKPGLRAVTDAFSPRLGALHLGLQSVRRAFDHT
jgi:hypothetical protein